MLAKPMFQQPERIPIDPMALRRTLAEVRRDRLAIFRRQESEPLVSVAAPIYGPADTVVAGLSILMPERDAQPQRLGLAMRTAAQAISRELGARTSIGMVENAPVENAPVD